MKYISINFIPPFYWRLLVLQFLHCIVNQWQFLKYRPWVTSVKTIYVMGSQHSITPRIWNATKIPTCAIVWIRNDVTGCIWGNTNEWATKHDKTYKNTVCQISARSNNILGSHIQNMRKNVLLISSAILTSCFLFH